jgi:hypothetical protein
MNEEKTESADPLEEEEEILRLAEELRNKGKDPVKILHFHLQTSEKMEQAMALGKEATTFLQKQWDAFEKEFTKRSKK